MAVSLAQDFGTSLAFVTSRMNFDIFIEDHGEISLFKMALANQAKVKPLFIALGANKFVICAHKTTVFFFRLDGISTINAVKTGPVASVLNILLIVVKKIFFTRGRGMALITIHDCNMILL